MNRVKTRASFSAKTGICVLFTILLMSGVRAKADIEPESLAAITERGMELWQVPGMSVAMVNSNEVLFQQGFGTTALVNGREVNEHTLFAIASTTKAMVVAGILMLVDEKKLSLDDLVTKHIPELHFQDPAITQQVTVRDLLAHRTGLPSTDVWAFFQAMPLDEQIRRLQAVEPVASIRTRLIYQNTMFELAGLIIERLSGQRWDFFLTERLWHPIGMLETFGARGLAGPEKEQVTPYYYVDKQLSVADWDWPADLADAAGSAWSSIHDMSLWAQFLLRRGVTTSGDRLLSKAVFEQMFEPHQLASTRDFYPTTRLTKPHWRTYGLGWFQQDFQGRMINFHTGSLGGLIAIIGLDRANDKAVVVLGNRDHAEMRHAVLWEVMDHNPPGQRRDWNQEIFDLYEKNSRERADEWQKSSQNRLKNTKMSLRLAAYPGTYRSLVNGDILVEPSGRNLVLRMALRDFEMTHWHLDTFLINYKPWDMHEFVTFHIKPDGSIGSMELLGDTFERLDDEE